jgi:hypothetical protein
MTRSEFIFRSSLIDFDVDFANEPYDVQFELGPKLYKKFLKSEFNDPTGLEYENIEKYLTLEYIDEDIDVTDED